MKIPFSASALRLAALTLTACAFVGQAHATSFTMEIVADNDFAVFGGTKTSVTSLLYQNDAGWPDQIANLSSFSFSLQPGQTTFYLLGMGGGGNENISGTINGVDIATIPVQMSSALDDYLTDWATSSGAVADGSYNASLTDVQAAFPHLTWGDPTPTTEADDVSLMSPTGHGFHFDPNTAHLFAFGAEDVGVSTAPEPANALLVIAGSIAVAAGSFRRLRSRRV
jgi:hypothetical protein